MVAAGFLYLLFVAWMSNAWILYRIRKFQNKRQVNGDQFVFVYNSRPLDLLRFIRNIEENALYPIRTNGKKIRVAGRSFNIPESTLRKKIVQKDAQTKRLGSDIVKIILRFNT
jgi:hypothetical protein